LHKSDQHRQHGRKRRAEAKREQRQFSPEQSATGAAECLRSRRHRAQCSICGQIAEELHSPTKMAGLFCREHCPVCSNERRQKPKPEGE